MTKPVLYGHHTSGHAYKVALALALSGIEYEYRHVDITSPLPERCKDFLAVSRFGEVPVLVRHGLPIVQSNAILVNLASAIAREEMDRVLERLFWEANRIGFSLPKYRLMSGSQNPHAPQIAEWLYARVLADLETLEGELSRMPFLLGQRFGVADISCAAYLLLDDNPISLKPWPSISAWLARIRSLPGWRPAGMLMPVQ